MPLKEKLDQITAWIDLPLEERPQLIMGNYSKLPCVILNNHTAHDSL